MKNNRKISTSYADAKLDYLSAADPAPGDITSRRRVYVNRRCQRPLHPHGMRMVRDGLMRIGRCQSLSARCRITYLEITDKGVAEIARLRKRHNRQTRKFC